jgi:PA14 domain
MLHRRSPSSHVHARRLLPCLTALALLLGLCVHVSTQPVSAAVRSQIDTPEPRITDNRPRGRDARVVLEGITTRIVPANSNIWQCACDTDGCWPGCFTVASATLLDYWANRGYPDLMSAGTPQTLQRLRDLFPNLFCYNNVDGDGKPGEAGYDAFDVARGFDVFIRERGYRFVVTPVPNPTFEQITAEIDAGRPLIGAFGESPWGSHAGTIIGYDTTDGKQIMIVRPNLSGRLDTELVWGRGYSNFGIVTVLPTNDLSDLKIAETRDIYVIVDDADSGFVMRGDWAARAGVGYGNAVRLIDTAPQSTPTEVAAEATWTPNLPFDGVYDVYAFVPFESGASGQGVTATYTLINAEGMRLIRLSQRDAKPGWQKLGSFPMVRGTASRVMLSNRADATEPQRLWADALRFVWRTPLLIQRESGGAVSLVQDGQAREFRDNETLDALRIARSAVRELGPVEFSVYPRGEPMPSIFSQWVGQYFDTPALTAPASVMTGAHALDAVWALPPMDTAVNGFSARWTRMLALTEGEYPFSVVATGGVRVWVEGRLEIDAWDAPSDQVTEHQRTVRVLSGLHRIVVEYARRGAGPSEIRFGNLPPNAPVVPEGLEPQDVTSPDIVLRWLDAGDPDGVVGDTGVSKPRRFFASLWRDADGDQPALQLSSGWITATQWALTLPGDGRYFWNVLATDGTLNSASTTPRTLLFDTTAPWSQMQSAWPAVGLIDPSVPNASLRLVNDADGTQRVVAVESAAPLDPTQPARSVVDRSLYEAYKDAPVIRLRWWATDTFGLRGVTYTLQARETVQARTEYTLTSRSQVVTRLGSELVLSGTQEITQPVVLTTTEVFTDIAPILVIKPVSASAWITIASGLEVTETVFVGYPGSRYEFRISAVDGAGNAQGWHDGFAVEAQIDEAAVLGAYTPHSLLTALVRAAPPVLTQTVSLTGTLPLTLTNPFRVTATPVVTADGLLSVTVPVTVTSVATATVTATTPGSTPDVSGLTIMPTIAAGDAPTTEGAQPQATQTPSPTAPGGLSIMPTLPPEIAIFPTPTPTATPIPVTGP